MADIAASVLAKLNAGISYQQCPTAFFAGRIIEKALEIKI